MPQPVRNFVRPACDGRIAMETTERAFWQSRMTRDGRAAPPVQLADLRQLAREIRKAVAA